MSKDRRKKPGPAKSAPSVMEMRAGPAPTISEPGSRVWRLGWNNQDAKAELEGLIVSHLTEEAVARIERMSPAAGSAYFGLFENNVHLGQYATFAPGWKHVMGGPDASWLFLLSLLREHQPDATAADARRLLKRHPEKARLAVGAVAPDFFEAVVRQIGVEPTATAEGVRAAAVMIAEAVLEKFPAQVPEPTPGPTAEPVTG